MLSSKHDFSKALLATILVLTTILATGCDGKAESDLAVSGMWVRAAEVTGQDSEAVSAAYMLIENSGKAGDRLTSADTDIAGMVEIHTVEMEGDVMRMRPVADGLEIPAESSVILEPGGYHIMLMGLQQSLSEGDAVSITLNFESGKSITVEAEIRVP